MRAKKRIPDLRKQSRIVTPRQNIWFYEEENLTSQRSGPEVNSIRNDRSTIYRNDFTGHSLEKQFQSEIKKECSFVVDWQLEDSF